jgi:hypothetical protein
MHVVVGWSADFCSDEVVKVLEVRFIEGVSDDFDVEVIKIRGGETVTEVWG